MLVCQQSETCPLLRAGLIYFKAKIHSFDEQSEAMLSQYFFVNYLIQFTIFYSIKY